MKREYWPTKAWQAAAPEALSLDADKLSNLDALIPSEYGNINGMVVVRNGYIAYEKYDHGYGPVDTHHVASVTKSVLSALIGIAIGAGYIDNADQKVLDFFPEYEHKSADRQIQQITLRHLLTMTAPYPFKDWHEPLDKMCMQPDWVAYTFDMLGKEEPWERSNIPPQACICCQRLSPAPPEKAHAPLRTNTCLGRLA